MSSSFSPALDLTENVIQESLRIIDSSFIISRVSGLCFNISLHPQHFMTVLEGHQVFNSIHEKLSEKFSINSFVAFTRFSFLHQKSWAIGLFFVWIVKRCFATHQGLITNQSAFINSVRVCSVSSFFLYCSKIFSVI